MAYEIRLSNALSDVNRAVGGLEHALKLLSKDDVQQIMFHDGIFDKILSARYNGMSDGGTDFVYIVTYPDGDGIGSGKIFVSYKFEEDGCLKLKADW